MFILHFPSAVYIPDPYVKIEFQGQPTIKFRTTIKQDENNPVWREKFKVLLPSRVRHIKATVSIDFSFCVYLYNPQVHVT